MIDNCAITCLDLFNNNFDKESVEIISRMLEKNKSLEYLGLSRNFLTNVDEILNKLKKRFLDEEETT